MKSMYMNYFKDGKLYQWDESKEVFLVQDTPYKGEFCFDKATMDTFLKLENPTIKVGKTVVATSGNIKATLKPIDATLSIPEFKDFQYSFKIDIDKIKLANKFIAKNVNSRPVLTGINFKNGYVTSTDSIIAYHAKIECDENVSITIMNSFIDILSSLKGEVELKTDGVVVVCENEGITYIGRTINGEYPNIEGIFAKGNYLNYNSIILQKDEIKKYLNLLNAGYIIFEDNKIIISEISSVENPNFEIDVDLPFSSRVCLDLDKFRNAINTINSDEVEFYYADEMRIVKFNDEIILCPCRIA